MRLSFGASRSRARGVASLVVLFLAAVLSGCAVAVPWRVAADPASVFLRSDGRDTIVYFALPGRELSDRMEQGTLNSTLVLAALQRGDFCTAWLDGFRRADCYDAWLCGGEGMGVCVLDAAGQLIAARPGPQDPPELAAWIDLVANRRSALQKARAAVAAMPFSAAANYQLGCLSLELGCRVGTEAALLLAADVGIADAWQQLARLAVLSGQLEKARDYLAKAPDSAASACTEGYLRFKERRHAEAVLVLSAALARPDLGLDRQRTLLFLAKALHETGAEIEAMRVLDSLIAEGTGSTFEGAARHTRNHIQNPVQGHTH